MYPALPIPALLDAVLVQELYDGRRDEVKQLLRTTTLDLHREIRLNCCSKQAKLQFEYNASRGRTSSLMV